MKKTLPMWSRGDRWILLTLIAAVAAVFYGGLSYEFVNWEDDVFVVGDLHYKTLTWPNLKWMFASHLIGTYQPFCWLVWAGLYKVFGLSTTAFHAFGIALHALMIVGVFVLARRLLRGEESSTKAVSLAAAGTALLWGLHPLQVEMVALAGVQADLLASVCLLYSVLTYIVAVDGGKKQQKYFYLSWALALCSGLSRWHVAALPVFLVVLDGVSLGRLPPKLSQWGQRALRPVWLEKIPYVLIAVAATAANLAAKTVSGRGGAAPAATLVDTLGALIFYPVKLLWPVNLLPAYHLSMVPSPLPWPPLLGAVAVVAVTIALVLGRRRWPAAFGAWLCYAAAIAPTLSVYLSSKALYAHDRYAYVAVLPLFLLVGALLRRIAKNRLAIASLIGLLLVLGIGAHKQHAVWRDAETLWRHVLAVAPRFPGVHLRLGKTLEAQQRFADAIALYRQQLEFAPRRARANLARAYYGWAKMQVKDGQFAAAAKSLEQTVSYVPRHGYAHALLARVYDQLGRSADAQASREAARRYAGDIASFHFRAAKLQLRQGSPEKAIKHLQEALSLDPTHRPAALFLKRLQNLPN
jgi:tetratricopeptide (TPR) repeat protein